jgi:hypothetical protein
LTEPRADVKRRLPNLGKTEYGFSNGWKRDEERTEMTVERTAEYLNGLLKELLKLPKETEWVEFKHNNANREGVRESERKEKVSVSTSVHF